MISQQVWEMLLRQAVQVTIVIALVGAIARIFRRWPHGMYVLWLVVLVKLLVPPVWSSPTSIFGWMDFHRAEAWTQQAVSRSVAARPDSARAATMGRALLKDEPAISEKTPMRMIPLPAISKPVVHRSIPLWQVMLAAWAVGACGLLVIVALQWLSLRRRIERSSIRPSRELMQMVLELRQELGIRRAVRLRVCQQPMGPAVVGALRPMLVIPAGILQDKPLAQIRAILAHEMIHLRRGDPLVGGVQILAQAIWWFHPLVWWMNRSISRVREMCCDREALASLRCQPADYAQMLIDVLRMRRNLSFGSPMLSLGVHPMQVTSQRLRQIMNGSRAPGKRMGWINWVLIALLGLIILPGAGIGGATDGIRWDGYPRLAPFDAIQWNGRTPQVRVNGTWYELLAVNDVPASDIVAYSAKLNPELAKKHFGEDLVELLTLMGHTPGDTVTLQVKDLSGGKAQTLKDVPMTEKNRRAVLMAGFEDSEPVGLRDARVSFEARHFVRIVVEKRGITYQGGKINLDELPAALLEVPDAAHTVVELAVASDDVTVGQFDQVQAVAGNAVQRMGFEYLSYIGKQDADSKGSPDQMILTGQKPAVDGATPMSVLPALPPAAESQLTHVVKIQIGQVGFHPGDSIEIKEVRGTSDQFEVGGTYQVTGRYTLTSRDHAILALSLTAKDPKNGYGQWGKWQSIKIDRGEGNFTLTERMPCDGYPHLSFYGKDGSGFGGVYFGTGDWVSY